MVSPGRVSSPNAYSAKLSCSPAREPTEGRRGEQAVARHVPRASRARYATRRATACEQIRQTASIGTQHSPLGIHLETALGVKQGAGDFHRVVRRTEHGFAGEVATERISAFTARECRDGIDRGRKSCGIDASECRKCSGIIRTQDRPRLDGIAVVIKLKHQSMQTLIIDVPGDMPRLRNDLDRLLRVAFGLVREPLAANVDTPATGVNRRWISIAAAAGLIIGLLGGQVVNLLPPQSRRLAPLASSLAPSPDSVTSYVPARLTLPQDDGLLGEVDFAVQLRSARELRALDELTPFHEQ